MQSHSNTVAGREVLHPARAAGPGERRSTTLENRWSRCLDELRRCGRLRVLPRSTGVDLCSNDYLGHAGRAGEHAAAGADSSPERSGSSSRLIRGHCPIWEQLEAALADWHSAGSALIMSSGYAANEGLLSCVIERDDWVASDRSNHASIIDGIRLSRAARFIYRHGDLNHLNEGLGQAAAHRSLGQQLFIVTESLFGMEGDIAPLEEMAALAERYEAQLIVDEAHATGCFGPEGSGLVDAMGLRSRVMATVHTGGKALAVCGAYICGSTLLKDLLINRCRQFMFSTALPPAVGRWWLEAIRRVQQDQQARAAVHHGARIFRQALAHSGIAAPGNAYIVPVIVGEDERAMGVARWLQLRGWDVRAFRPPTVPPGTARLRISIHADHPTELLLGAAGDVAEAIQEA